MITFKGPEPSAHEYCNSLLDGTLGARESEGQVSGGYRETDKSICSVLCLNRADANGEFAKLTILDWMEAMISCPGGRLGKDRVRGTLLEEPVSWG
jgi:hypothetical protein